MMLVTGKTVEYVFSPEDSAAYITQHVYDNWPEGNFHSIEIVINLLKVFF